VGVYGPRHRGRRGSPVSTTARHPRKRRRPLPLPRTWSEQVYIEVPREEIWYVKFILEAYENLAYFSVIDKYRAVLQLVFSKDGEQELHALVRGLAQEIPLKCLPLGPMEADVSTPRWSSAPGEPERTVQAL
jgi:hypothetical protein